jgi:hypothetical protein
MAIQKNFVIKNGLEVDTNLIVADAQTNKVGIGTTVPQYTLHVNGGIGVTNAYVSGISTFVDELNVGLGGTVLTVLGLGNSIGVGTTNPAFLLDVRSPVSTGQTALFVRGDIQVTGGIRADDILITNLNIPGVSTFVGLSTFNDYVFIQDGLNVTGTGATLASLNVLGVSTFVGLSTFNDYVFIQDGLNVTGTGATLASLNVLGVSTFNDLLVAGISTFNNLNSQNLNISGIATLSNVFLGGYLSVGGTTGQQNQVLVSTGVGVTWKTNSNLRNSTSFTATLGQTTFSATYSIGYVDVYINGVKLTNTEFVATNGTSIVLNDACFGGEAVEIISFEVEYPLTFSGITLQEEGSVVGTGISAINFVGAAVTAVSVGAGSTIFVNAQLPLTSFSNVEVGIITATGGFVGTLTGTATTAQGLTGTPNIAVGIITATDGFVSTANTTPIQIQLVGNQLTFNAVGIGSTTLTLF